MLQLLRDEDVIAEAREEAQNLLARDPELADHPALKAELDALAAGERAEYLEKT
jgi:ATP-dependent DNA helicase RecG